MLLIIFPLRSLLLPQQIIPHETKVNHLEIYGPTSQNDERTNARLLAIVVVGRGQGGGRGAGVLSGSLWWDKAINMRTTFVL